jgi:hypothetical protein
MLPDKRTNICLTSDFVSATGSFEGKIEHSHFGGTFT